MMSENLARCGVYVLNEIIRTRDCALPLEGGNTCQEGPIHSRGFPSSLTFIVRTLTHRTTSGRGGGVLQGGRTLHGHCPATAQSPVEQEMAQPCFTRAAAFSVLESSQALSLLGLKSISSSDVPVSMAPPQSR